MKRMKQRLAVLLAVLLMLPSQPFTVAASLSGGDVPQEVSQQQEETQEDDESQEEDEAQKDDASQEEDETQKDDAGQEEDETQKDDAGQEEDETQKDDAGQEEDETQKDDADQEEDETQKDDVSQEEDETQKDEADQEEGETQKDDAGQEEDETQKDEADQEEDETQKDDAGQEEDETQKDDVTQEEDSQKGGEDQNEDETQGSDEVPEEELIPEEEQTEEEVTEEEIPEEPVVQEETLISEEELEEIPELIGEEIIFNTGNFECSVVNESDFYEYELGDVYFDEDGSYTIQIPEANPFFPYEVQFTYDDEVTNEWFMTPDDSVEIGDHTFYVSAYFDGTAVTQMSLEVAGDTVIVYPQEKEFTDGDGTALMSLLPLEEKELEVDLSVYTPVELTMVSVDSIFTGENELEDTDSVVWSCESRDGYKISESGDVLDLSYETCWQDEVLWQMIVGDADQLASENIRYLVNVKVTESEQWLVPSLYAQAEDGTRTELEITEYSYYDGSYNGTRRLYSEAYATTQLNDKKVYIGLEVDEDIFSDTVYAELKAYQGKFKSIKEVLAALNGSDEITDQIFSKDLTAENAGYLVSEEGKSYFSEHENITLVALDTAGNVVGYLPVTMWMEESANYITMSLCTDSEYGKTSVYSDWYESEEDEIEVCTYILEPGYAADGEYYLSMSYYSKGEKNTEAVTAAYIGTYDSIAEAQKQGAKNIKDQLFVSSSDGGYAADYSKGVYITVFVGKDGSAEQELYNYLIKTEEEKISLSSSTLVYFYGLADAEGKTVDAYVVDSHEDSYADYNFLTILVDETVDLTQLAPRFSKAESIHLYAEGGNSPEVSGKSIHDFSDGPVQYTASAENGEDSQNYWLQIVQAGENSLYINSLADEDAETEEEGGVIYSTREILLDGRHDYYHDILLINMDTEPVEALSVELVSDQVELDEYWNLNGKYALSGFSGAGTTTGYGELPNLAKLRIFEQDDVREGSDISGTLTIKSGDTVLMVLTLTGTVGDPSIVTTEIPDAVKYVPYGTMIQNSNRYRDNKVTYSLIDGSLPVGMIVKPNGEIYGVPKTAGEFTFTVRMRNSDLFFDSSEMEYTLIVAENTDANVDSATDAGYDLIQRVPDISLNNTENHTLVSQGVYGEFVDIFLDGEKLTEGVDYDSESGSTRITIRSQTLKGSGEAGTHTLGVEFRTESDNTLKRAAQNYRLNGTGSSNGNTNTNVSSSSDRDRSSRTSGRTRDAQKGFMDAASGIITGEGADYAAWQQDEFGWKLIYADGTAAAGTQIMLADGTQAEQVLWEKINGKWYAFGANEYLKSGWVYDYQLGSWYAVSIENGMQTGWYADSVDGYTYYLDPATGKIALGWKQIDQKWYLFNNESQGKTWLFDERTGLWYYDILSRNKPLGAMYRDERTPDGYFVGADGAWDGKQ